jgi:arylsulfatase A
VGQILNALRQNKIDDNTLVIFTSDNGPWALYGDHGGSAAPLRGYKATAFDGGVRVPFIARWPKRLPAGRVIHNPAMTIDLLPTVARLIGAKLPADRIIDGRDLWALLSGVKNAPDPHDALYFYWGQELQAVRSGRWKLHLPHDYDIHTPGNGGGRGKVSRQRIELSLFNLETDIGETTNVADQYPDVVKRLMKYVERARTDLGDSLTGREGKNLRPAGKLGVSSN